MIHPAKASRTSSTSLREIVTALTLCLALSFSFFGTSAEARTAAVTSSGKTTKTSASTTSSSRKKAATAKSSRSTASGKTVAKTAAKHGSRKHRTRVIEAKPVPTSGERLGLRSTADELALQSSVAMVVDQATGEPLVLKNPDVVLPIASLTKLMTALVVLDAKLPMDEMLEITSEDVDTERKTHSRLVVGTELTRGDMLQLALMSSENRAALALSRNYPGGRSAFIDQMNAKALSLGMTSTHYADPAGLSNGSVSTARDLHRLLSAAYAQPIIRADSTQTDADFRIGRHVETFVNTNRLVRGDNDWDIELQKTGFTNEAGRCLVMQTMVLNRRLAMIFLDSTGTLTRYADATRVRRWLEKQASALQPHLPNVPMPAATATKVSAFH